MPFTARHYRDHLKALLPPGIAFPRERGTKLHDLVSALAEELARIDARADRLVTEALPASTIELLPDWERVAGLPDECNPAGGTLSARRAALIAKLASVGGQTPVYFKQIAEDLTGYAVEVNEFFQFRAGYSCAGDPVCNEDWAYTWQIIGQTTPFTYFRAGQSNAGERLREWEGNDVLECVINRYKPAHTVLIFGYQE